MDKLTLLEILTYLIEEFEFYLQPYHSQDHDFIDDPDKPGSCKYCGWYHYSEAQDLRRKGQEILENYRSMRITISLGIEEEIEKVRCSLSVYIRYRSYSNHLLPGYPTLSIN